MRRRHIKLSACQFTQTGFYFIGNYRPEHYGMRALFKGFQLKLALVSLLWTDPTVFIAQPGCNQFLIHQLPGRFDN